MQDKFYLDQVSGRVSTYDMGFDSTYMEVSSHNQEYAIFTLYDPVNANFVDVKLKMWYFKLSFIVKLKLRLAMIKNRMPNWTRFRSLELPTKYYKHFYNIFKNQLEQ